MKRSIIILGAIVLLFNLSNCNKEVEGCTDPDATNFNSAATADNGNCTYAPSLSVTNTDDEIEPSGNAYTIDVDFQGSASLVTLYYTASSPEFTGGTYFARTMNNPADADSYALEVELLEQNLLGEHTFFVECADVNGELASTEFSFELEDRTDPVIEGEATIIDPQNTVTLWEPNAYSVDINWSDNYMLQSAKISTWEVDGNDDFVALIHNGVFYKEYAEFINADATLFQNPATFVIGGSGRAMVVVEIEDVAGNVTTHTSMSFDAEW